MKIRKWRRGDYSDGVDHFTLVGFSFTDNFEYNILEISYMCIINDYDKVKKKEKDLEVETYKIDGRIEKNYIIEKYKEENLLYSIKIKLTRKKEDWEWIKFLLSSWHDMYMYSVWGISTIQYFKKYWYLHKIRQYETSIVNKEKLIKYDKDPKYEKFTKFGEKDYSKMGNESFQKSFKGFFHPYIVYRFWDKKEIGQEYVRYVILTVNKIIFPEIKLLFVSEECFCIFVDKHWFIILENEKNKYKIKDFVEIKIYTEEERRESSEEVEQITICEYRVVNGRCLKYHIARVLALINKEGNMFEQYDNDEFLDQMELKW